MAFAKAGAGLSECQCPDAVNWVGALIHRAGGSFMQLQGQCALSVWQF